MRIDLYTIVYDILSSIMHFSASTLGGLAAISATANAALVRVSDFGSNPASLQMNIYVPATLVTKPAIIVAVSE